MKSITFATLLLLCLLANSIELFHTEQFDQVSSDESSEVSNIENLGNFYPPAFDLRQYFTRCSFPVYEEGMCSASWAISLASTLSDLICIRDNKNVILSAQQVLDCVLPSYDSCRNMTNSTVLNAAVTYAIQKGLTDYTCYPYTSLFTGEVNSQCKLYCSNGLKINTTYQATSVTMLQGINATKDALENGSPVLVSYLLYDDLLRYNGGTYSHSSSALYLGVHYGRIVGWGTDSSNNQYWIVSNTFGTYWGINGYFYFSMADSALKSFYLFTVAQY